MQDYVTFGGVNGGNDAGDRWSEARKGDWRSSERGVQQRGSTNGGGGRRSGDKEAVSNLDENAWRGKRGTRRNAALEAENSVRTLAREPSPGKIGGFPRGSRFPGEPFPGTGEFRKGPFRGEGTEPFGGLPGLGVPVTKEGGQEKGAKEGSGPGNFPGNVF